MMDYVYTYKSLDGKYFSSCRFRTWTHPAGAEFTMWLACRWLWLENGWKNWTAGHAANTAK